MRTDNGARNPGFDAPLFAKARLMGVYDLELKVILTSKGKLRVEMWYAHDGRIVVRKIDLMADTVTGIHLCPDKQTALAFAK